MTTPKKSLMLAALSSLLGNLAMFLLTFIPEGYAATNFANQLVVLLIALYFMRGEEREQDHRNS